MEYSSSIDHGSRLITNLRGPGSIVCGDFLVLFSLAGVGVVLVVSRRSSVEFLQIKVGLKLKKIDVSNSNSKVFCALFLNELAARVCVVRCFSRGRILDRAVKGV